MQFYVRENFNPLHKNVARTVDVEMCLCRVFGESWSYEKFARGNADVFARRLVKSLQNINLAAQTHD